MSAYSSAVLALSPFLYWRLGASGTTDQSGNGRNGTANGGVTIGGAGTLVAGDPDAATSFDGLDDFVINGTTVNIAQASVALWFQYSVAPASDKWIAGFVNGYNNGTADKFLLLDSTGKVKWDCFDGTERFTTSTSGISSGVPHLLVGTADGTNIHLYIDGVEAAPATACGATFTTYTVPNIFCSGSQATRGQLAFVGDEFAIWNSALTAPQIAGLYAAASVASPRDVLLRGVG